MKEKFICYSKVPISIYVDICGLRWRLSKAYCEKQQTNKQTKTLKYEKKSILEVNKVKPRKKENMEKMLLIESKMFYWIS